MSNLLLALSLALTLTFTGCSSNDTVDGEFEFKLDKNLVVYCSDCGEETSRITEFCSNCGSEATWLNEKNKDNKKKDVKTKDKIAKNKKKDKKDDKKKEDKKDNKKEDKKEDKKEEVKKENKKENNKEESKKPIHKHENNYINNYDYDEYYDDTICCEACYLGVPKEEIKYFPGFGLVCRECNSNPKTCEYGFFSICKGCVECNGSRYFSPENYDMYYPEYGLTHYEICNFCERSTNVYLGALGLCPECLDLND